MPVPDIDQPLSRGPCRQTALCHVPAGVQKARSAGERTFAIVSLLAPSREGVADLSLHGSLQGDWVLQDVPEDSRHVWLMLGQEASAWQLQYEFRATQSQHL